MRKFFTLFALCLISMSTWAETFEVGGINYDVTSTSSATVKVGDNTEFTGTSVTIPATVTYESTEYTVTAIGDNAFKFCSSLASVTFAAGSQLETIGDSAFAGSGLTSITMPSEVSTIGEYAFLDCKSLTQVTIPAKVTSIGASAFGLTEGEDNVTISVTCLPTTPPTIAESSFANLNDDSEVYVPFGSLGAYVNAENWSNFAGLFSFKSSVTLNSCGYATFSATCNVNLPEGLTAYKATQKYTNYVHLDKIDDPIPSNTGVLLAGKASQTYEVSYTDYESTADCEGNIFSTTDGTTAQQVGDYILNGDKFYPLTSGGAIAAGKAYIPGTSASGAKLQFEFGEPTSVNDIQEANTQVQRGKYIENGRIVILKNNKKFNLAGQSLN